MQKTGNNILSLLVLVAYMLASTGFGIHECSNKGTKHILLIVSDRSCEQIHDHCSCNSNSCSTSKQSNNCCSTEIYHLDFGYDITEASANSSLTNELKVIDFPEFALSISCNTGHSIQTTLGYRDGPPVYCNTHQILASLAQWRL